MNEKFLGKTVVVGTFIEANDKIGIFNINGNDYEIEPIHDNGDFLSPLKLVQEGKPELTMKEFLCHPKKSEKRKFKNGDNILLVLHRFINKEDNKIFFRLQNALIYARKLNIVDDYEYNGIALKASNITQLIKRNNKGLPLYSITISKRDNTKEEIIKTLNLLKDLEIITNFLTLSIFKDKEYSSFKFLLKEEFKDNLKDFFNEKEIKESLSFEDIIEKINNIKEEDFNFSFLLNGSKKTEIFDKYKKIILNNCLVKKKSKIPIVNKVNKKLEEFYNPKSIINDNKDSLFSEKIVYGELTNPDYNTYSYSPAILSIKNTYTDEDEKHYIINAIIPDLIKFRKLD